MRPITVSTEARRGLINHIRKSLPHEGVGLMAGSTKENVELILPLLNISENQRAFLADPFEQYTALQRIKAMGLELIAIYHSHPGGGSSPSLADLKNAERWQCWHLIIPVNSCGSVPGQLDAFRCLSDNSIEKVTVAISNSPIL